MAVVAVVGLLAAACGGTGATGRDVDRAGTGDRTIRATAAASVSAKTPSSPAGHSSVSGSSPAPTPASSPAPTPSGTPLAAVGPGERSVVVLALNGYVEWGGADPQVNWVGPFERRTGCKVNLRYLDQDPGVDQDVEADSFDVVSAPPDLAGRLIAEGRIATLNTSLISDYKEIPSRLRELPAVKDGDRVYGVPYLWGVNEVLYNRSKVRPKSVAAVFEDDGPVMLRDSPLTIADAALALKRRDKDLGIGNPFQLTPAQLDAAVKLLTAGKSGGRTYWRDSIDVIRGFASDSVRLAQATPYHLEVLTLGRKPVESLADRPVTGWVDSWMLSAAAAHPNCAYKWLDWTSSVRVQKKAAAWTGLAPANFGACEGGATRICAAYGAAEGGDGNAGGKGNKAKSGDKGDGSGGDGGRGGAQAFRGVSFAVRPAQDCGTRRDDCTDYAEWIKRWSRLTR